MEFKTRDQPPHMTSSVLVSAETDTAFLFQCSPITDNHATVVDASDDEADTFAITCSQACRSTGAKQDEGKLLKGKDSEKADPPPTFTSDKGATAYKYEFKAASPDAAKQVYQFILSTPVPTISVSDLLAISSGIL